MRRGQNAVRSCYQACLFHGGEQPLSLLLPVACLSEVKQMEQGNFVTSSVRVVHPLPCLLC